MKSDKEIEEVKTETARPSLTEGLDFYLDNGLMVLTEHFLTRRGYCCGNGCRHCPYDSNQRCSLK
jgi:hypothetical protein